jgi:hypothetical protein
VTPSRTGILAIEGESPEEPRAVWQVNPSGVQKEGWNVKETEKRVNQALGKAVSESGGKGVPQKHPHTPTPPHSDTAVPDPLGPDFWPHVQLNPAMVRPGNWGVSHGRQPVGVPVKGKPVSLPAWGFWLLSAAGAPPKATIKKWALALAEAMGDTDEEEKGMQKTKTALMPANPAEWQKTAEERKGARLPQTPQDWVEFEAEAQKGPGSAATWLYGQSSLTAGKYGTLTWKDLGQDDPAAGCRDMVRRLTDMQERQKVREEAQGPKPDSAAPAPERSPQPVPASTALTEEEQERLRIKAKVEAIKAKFGRIL